MTAPRLPPPLVAEVGRRLAERCGLSLSSGLAEALHEGVRGAAERLGIGVAELATRVCAGDPVAVEALTEHAVVTETSFNRHPEGLAALARRAFGAAGPLAIWSAGCATGEEAYSLAIGLLEAGRAGRGDRVLATDVSRRALEAARAGVYGAWALRRLAAALVEGRFSPVGPGAHRVGAEARALIEFRRHNLVAETAPEGGPFDVVVCRNVLIYFEPPTAAAVLYRLAGALRPGGWLLLGPVELPLAAGIGLEWVEEEGATLLRRSSPSPPAERGERVGAHDPSHLDAAHRVVIYRLDDEEACVATGGCGRRDGWPRPGRPP
ncbi:MAG TPA: protein-glutamate O-methyltransferase CheR [Anaeromyxobacteraceae bacterium]|nr:protein-glutamate O-methyltransferase CheR [Anaeromyxobacteraceae bacterium]